MAKQILEIDEMCDKIEDFKEVIEFLKISPAKNHNGEEAAIKMRSRLKAELECKQDLIIQEEFETSKLFSDIHHKRRIALDELHFKGTKLEKLGVSKPNLMRLKNQII